MTDQTPQVDTSVPAGRLDVSRALTAARIYARRLSAAMEGSSTVIIPALAAVVSGVLVWIWASPAPTSRQQLAGCVLLTLAVAATAAVFSLAGFVRLCELRRYAQLRRPGRTVTAREIRTVAARKITADDIRAAALDGEQTRLGPPAGTAEALRIIEAILAFLRPGPEQVTAACPGSTEVIWDIDDWRHRHTNLPGDRHDKMLAILRPVRRLIERFELLHQFPQVLLVADDGAAIELLGSGGHGRTGRAVGLEAPQPVPSGVPAT